MSAVVPVLRPIEGEGVDNGALVESRVEGLPQLVPCRPSRIVALPNYAVHRVVRRRDHSLYKPSTAVGTTTGGGSGVEASAARAATTSLATPLPSAPPPLRVCDGTWRAFVARDECVAREALEMEEIYAAASMLPFPPPWRTGAATSCDVHPAVDRGARLLAHLESYARHTIESDYADLFQSRPFREAHLLVRLAFRNLGPAKVHLRRWVWRYRARKTLFALQTEKLLAQETQQRYEWSCTSDLAQERSDLLSGILCALESQYRVQMERLYLLTAHATAVVGVRLAERAGSLKVFFGGPMRAAKTCGRLSGLTVFSTLALEEAHSRAQIEQEHQHVAATLPSTAATIKLQRVEETQARQAIESAYATSAAECFRRVLMWEAHYTLRDVERYEAVERQRLLKHAPPARPSAMIPDDESEESTDSEEEQL